MVKVVKFPTASQSGSGGSGGFVLLCVIIIVGAVIYKYTTNDKFKLGVDKLLGISEPETTKTTTTVKTSSGANAPVTNYVGKRFMDNPFDYEREKRSKQF